MSHISFHHLCTQIRRRNCFDFHLHDLFGVDHPGQCWHNETNIAYDPGAFFTSHSSTGCTKVQCLDDLRFVYIS